MLIEVDHKLRIAQSELPQDVEEAIKEALSIPNRERQRMMEQNIWGWKRLPERIPLWSVDPMSKCLVLPRGFYSNLLAGLEACNIDFQLVDNRTWDSDVPVSADPVPLHPWQVPAVQRIFMFEQGIWKAPPGSGKTVAVLEAIRRLKCPSIVLVNTKDILWQWRERARGFLGDIPMGLIGDGGFEVGEFLTIATVQTLHSRFRELERNGFFEQFSFLCLDECHHATAETYNQLVNRFTCRYRIGVSATPDKTGDFELALNVLGPIFHETPRENVDSLVAPEVFKIPTRFRFKYRGRHGNIPSNYSELLSCLITDPHRNALIVKSIMIDEGSHALVVSKRLEHLELIKLGLTRLGYKHPIMMLTGDTDAELRQTIVGISNQQPSCVLSTLADEAIDIPRLDSLFLVFPQRNSGLIEQQVGRICRSHPDKDRAVVFDFADCLIGPLDNQWRTRRNQVYEPHGYTINIVKPEDIINYDTESEDE